MSGRRLAPRALVGALALGLVLTGCMSLPTSGKVPANWLQGSAGAAQQAQQVIPVPPGPHWTASQIVEGFVAASGTSEAVAREYLAPKFQWRPGQPTILPSTPTYNVVSAAPPAVRGAGQTYAVQVTSHHVETLKAGNIVFSPGPHAFTFDLVRVKGQLRISEIQVGGKPAPALRLISQADFASSFQPRNLYYFPADGQSAVASAISTTLIPDPVYLEYSSPRGAASQIVRDLFKSPQNGWLRSAAVTAFPPGTRLLGVQVSGIRAVVDLGGAAKKASMLQRQQMAAQVIWSLTNSPYSGQSSSQITSVTLQIDHRTVVLRRDHKALLGLRRDFQSWVPSTSQSPLYFQRAAPSYLGPQIRVLDKVMGGAPAPAQLPSGLGQGPFTHVAISPRSPGSPGSAVLAGCRGKNLYVTWMKRSAKPIVQTLPADCTSLSWDRSGDLWIAAGQIYQLPSAGNGLVSRQLTPVANPALASQPSSTPMSLRVAPDGVRVAMIVHEKSGNRVFVAAISKGPKSSSLLYLAQSSQMVPLGSDISNAQPIALTWWDPDHLLVLFQPSQPGAPQIYEVPLNGGQSHQVPTPRDAISLTAAGSELVVGTAVGGGTGAGQDPIQRYEHHLNGPWSPVGEGSTPAFPG